MPLLERTERAVAWGVLCRYQLLAVVYTALVLDGETREAEWAETADRGLVPVSPDRDS
ncbi:hypothetical protein [Streptomyces sp. NPDC001068]|uniref:hypothetical protein n=1 Tax=Streptomyces sp. NPDC001068 TaxID=3364544 RepID=UPI0036B65523